MPKKTGKPKTKKNPAAVAMAKRRAESLSPARRKEISEKAIATRWAKAKSTPAKKKAAESPLRGNALNKDSE